CIGALAVQVSNEHAGPATRRRFQRVPGFAGAAWPREVLAAYSDATGRAEGVDVDAFPPTAHGIAGCIQVAAQVAVLVVHHPGADAFVLWTAFDRQVGPRIRRYG